MIWYFVAVQIFLAGFFGYAWLHREQGTDAAWLDAFVIFLWAVGTAVALWTIFGVVKLIQHFIK